MQQEDEDARLRSVALQNAQTILLARQRAEQELIRAKEALELNPVTFVEAAIETVRPAAEAKAIRLEKRLDPSAGPLSGDPNRLQ
ncbi:MAG: hypothetical protein ACXWUK_12945 [Burkholderiales bacterium]